MKLSVALLSLVMAVNSIAFATDGSNSGGGGGNLARREMQDSELSRSNIQHVKRLLPVILLRLDQLLEPRFYDSTESALKRPKVDININNWGPYDVTSDLDFSTVKLIHGKFFDSKNSIYTALENAKIVVRPTCSHNGKTMDGSANIVRNSICISKKSALLLDKFRSGPEILGLIAHEASHLIGASEKEAVTLQRLVLAFTPSDILNQMYSATGILFDLNNIVEALVEVKNGAELMDSPSICSKLGNAAKTAELTSNQLDLNRFFLTMPDSNRNEDMWFAVKLRGFSSNIVSDIGCYTNSVTASAVERRMRDILYDFCGSIRLLTPFMNDWPLESAKQNCSAAGY